MTPKEEAHRIIMDYVILLKAFKSKRLNDKPIIKLQTKQITIECALICVEEIINSNPINEKVALTDTGVLREIKHMDRYWQAVKQEILNYED